jgi:hypothetical protein
MVVEFTTTSAIITYHHLSCEFEPHSRRGVLDKTLCDINFLFISINEKNWFAESRFFVGVRWMEFVSHVKFRQLQTQR